VALALYRKYRPATFSEVVGQEHVTEPLRTALAAGRINHAYLFSGPRGCGKTSSARILARSLNCVHGPTPDPCGECPSCIALAPEGPGSLDVVELDAASHGGVDDTRDLRDKAFYMPSESRFRVFIIDEAHMVTTQGFNALLKIVEEPPEHLVFIFATTEPDKVLTTIRSRTHHYPFRLIPPTTLRALLERLCAEEGAVVEPAVLPLVIRAGGGSARDSLSVLDQLLAGAGPEGVTYRSAVALLGVTDAALIDEVVDALAAGDGASVFGAVDRVVEAGHDPRRFAADLLERLRDLVILNAVPDAVTKGLIDAPEDELAAMAGQADRLGVATLTRMAEVLHTGLVDMRGTTSPRLLLELLCARMLLPGSAAGDASLLQRLERMERRMDIAAEHQAGGAADRDAARAPARSRTAAPSVPAGPVPTQSAPAPSDSGAPSDGSAPAAGGGYQRRSGAVAAPSSTSAAGSEQAAAGRSGDRQPSGGAAAPRTAPTRRAGPDLGLPVPPTLSTTRPAGGQSRAVSGDDRASVDRSGGPDGSRERADSTAGGQAGQAASERGSGPRNESRPDGASADGPAPSGSARGAEAPDSVPADVRGVAGPSSSDDSGSTDRRTADGAAATTDGATTTSAPRGAAEGSPGSATAARPADGSLTADAPPTSADAIGVTDVRRVWPEVLAAVKERRRTTQILLESATVVAVESGVLHLSMPSAGTARRVLEPANADLLRGAVRHVLGVDWSIACTAGAPGAQGQSAGPARSSPSGPAGQRAGFQAAAEPVPPPPDEDIPDDYGEPPDPSAPAESVRDPEQVAIALLSAQLGARPLDPSV
jgi:DNA polymerase-3 subunit gamma/tau